MAIDLHLPLPQGLASCLLTAPISYINPLCLEIGNCKVVLKLMLVSVHLNMIPIMQEKDILPGLNAN